jgi:hypothetical protein
LRVTRSRVALNAFVIRNVFLGRCAFPCQSRLIGVPLERPSRSQRAARGPASLLLPRRARLGQRPGGRRRVNPGRRGRRPASHSSARQPPAARRLHRETAHPAPALPAPAVLGWPVHARTVLGPVARGRTALGWPVHAQTILGPVARGRPVLVHPVRAPAHLGRATSNSPAHAQLRRDGNPPTRPRRAAPRRTVEHPIAERRRVVVLTAALRLAVPGQRRARRRAPRANRVDRGGTHRNSPRRPPPPALPQAGLRRHVRRAIGSVQPAHLLALLPEASSAPRTKSVRLPAARLAATRDPARHARQQPAIDRRRLTAALGRRLKPPRTGLDRRSSRVVPRALSAACGVRQRSIR